MMIKTLNNHSINYITLYIDMIIANTSQNTTLRRWVFSVHLKIIQVRSVTNAAAADSLSHDTHQICTHMSSSLYVVRGLPAACLLALFSLILSFTENLLDGISENWTASSFTMYLKAQSWLSCFSLKHHHYISSHCLAECDQALMELSLHLIHWLLEWMRLIIYSPHRSNTCTLEREPCGTFQNHACFRHVINSSP